MDLSSDAALRLRVWQFYELGVRQRALADRMGISESTLGRWMRGESTAALRSTAGDGFSKFLAAVRQAVAFDPSALSRRELEEIEHQMTIWAAEQKITKRVRRRRTDSATPRARKR